MIEENLKKKEILHILPPREMDSFSFIIKGEGIFLTMLFGIAYCITINIVIKQKPINIDKIMSSKNYILQKLIAYV